MTSVAVETGASWDLHPQNRLYKQPVDIGIGGFCICNRAFDDLANRLTRRSTGERKNIDGLGNILASIQVDNGLPYGALLEDIVALLAYAYLFFPFLSAACPQYVRVGAFPFVTNHVLSHINRHELVAVMLAANVCR